MCELQSLNFLLLSAKFSTGRLLVCLNAIVATFSVSYALVFNKLIFLFIFFINDKKQKKEKAAKPTEPTQTYKNTAWTASIHTAKPPTGAESPADY